ncbi:MAG: hydantoinase/carbamoylase family amidase [Alphaproteobacteria bacterium]|nr:MAG: hydantoinase/carbamoylase family amidase [Alphaproteobacteria bacterium]
MSAALPATLLASINQDRLWQRHADMAAHGAIPGPRPDRAGVNRACFTAEDIAARQMLVGWATARGFEVSQDAIANLYIRRRGTESSRAPIVTGSHMDTQPRGGRFDGIYGVLAGFEVLEALEDAGIATVAPVEVVAWTNEEGGRFAPGTMGSMVFAGQKSVEAFAEVRDTSGVRFADALAATLAATPAPITRPLPGVVGGYVEAHIEQGPRLEAAGARIGVVTGIQGMRWFEVDITGETAHAGTCPVGQRRDALRSAHAVVSALYDVTRDPEDTLRFTIGRFLVDPGSPNTVPNRVHFTIDMRHPDKATLDRLADAIPATITAAVAPCTATVRVTNASAPMVFDQQVVDRVEAATKALGLPYLVMPSGAGHDAGYVARLAPAGMIFIPCERGVSHNEAEFATPQDLTNGTRVLAATLLAMAGVV